MAWRLPEHSTARSTPPLVISIITCDHTFKTWQNNYLATIPIHKLNLPLYQIFFLPHAQAYHDLLGSQIQSLQISWLPEPTLIETKVKIVNHQY